jgi:hypothetical protein
MRKLAYEVAGQLGGEQRGMESVEQSTAEQPNNRTKGRWERLLEADRRLAKRVEAVEKSGTIRIAAAGVAVVGIFILGGTIWQILSDYEARSAERIERAWARLLLPAGGNIGKASGLQTLLDAGTPLDDVDLSCQAIGDFDDASKTCSNAPIFRGFTYVDAKRRGHNDRVTVGNLNLSDASMMEFTIRNVFMSDVRLDRAVWYDCLVEDSYINSGYAPERIENCALRNSVFYLDFDKTELGNVEVSGSIFTTFPAGEVARAWAWADNRPNISASGSGSETEISNLHRGVTLCRPLPAGTSLPEQDPRTHEKHAMPECEIMTWEQAKEAYPKGQKEDPIDAFDGT